ncbi:MAG: ABC transporter permease [Patescibacteria group bacterium]
MQFHRIWGVILRYNYLFKHSLDRQVDAFYWPTVDLVLWGITSTYIASQGPNANLAVLMVVSGIVLWIVLWRGQYEFTVNILEDVWNKNLINMFVSPLKLSEWIAAFSTLGFVKAIISTGFASLIALLLYHIKIFANGLLLLPLLFLLLMTGWWVGLFVGGMIMRFGTKVQNFAWSMVFIIAPFSAVYYPLTALPNWAQKIAFIVPSSYVFEAARQVFVENMLDWNKVIIAFSLNILYLVLALMFFKSSFKKVLDRGLVKFQ